MISFNVPLLFILSACVILSANATPGFIVPLSGGVMGLAPTNFNNDAYNISVVHGGFGLYIELHVGNPPQEVTLFLDTGSHMSWLECGFCRPCYQKNVSLHFDPGSSESAEVVSCSDRICRDDLLSCKNGKCLYTVSYANNDNSTGVIVTDSLSIRSVVGQPGNLRRDKIRRVLDKFIFGCSSVSSITVLDQGIGIAGLSTHELSLVSQLKVKRFSHCFSPLIDFRLNSLIRFGSKANFGQNTVKLLKISGHDHYNIPVEGISVGSKGLDISSSAFTVDSGTFISRLHYSAFNPLVAELLKQIPSQPFIDRQGLICFDEIDTQSWPRITLHLPNYNFVLPPSVYYCYSDVCCIGFFRTNRMSVIGFTAMVDYDIGYDLGEKMISFQPKNCALDNYPA